MEFRPARAQIQPEGAQTPLAPAAVQPLLGTEQLEAVGALQFPARSTARTVTQTSSAGSK